jgi:hypothetical protein
LFYPLVRQADTSPHIPVGSVSPALPTGCQQQSQAAKGDGPMTVAFLLQGGLSVRAAGWGLTQNSLIDPFQPGHDLLPGEVGFDKTAPCFCQLGAKLAAAGLILQQ